MGLVRIALKSIAQYSVADALDSATDALDKASLKIQENEKKRNRKLVKKPTGTEVLIIKKQQTTWTDKFEIFDENLEVKYRVKGHIVSIKQHFDIFDANGNELGSVKEKAISLRSPISFESSPIDFIIEIGGEQLGTVKSRGLLRRYYEVSFNGWRIEGNVFGWKYRIISNNEEIANISQKLLFSSETYVINFPDSKNEIIVLMLVIALAAANARLEAKAKRENLHTDNIY